MHLSLATKISLAVVGVLVLAVLSSVVAIFSAYRIKSFQETIVEENLASVRAAEELEIALLEQRGYVASFILSEGDETWLGELRQRRDDFDRWLRLARDTTRSDAERAILDQLEDLHQAYAGKRDEVVKLYKSNDPDQAKHVLLNEVVKLYQDSYELCEKFIAANQQLVEDKSEEVRQQVEILNWVVTATLTVTLLLGLALLWLFFAGVIFPLRRIAADARDATGQSPHETVDAHRDELRELGHQVQLLMSNVAETRSDLDQSRTQLAHAEKLAAVGKLAASVAHEIRNPLTAMKMWLYSLRRSLASSDDSLQKLDVVSEEIMRLEKIVRNFLEFSRPPQLKLGKQDFSIFLDKVLELQRYHLEAGNVQVTCHYDPDLPQVVVDVEQLRQVFVNLINNAVEAMPAGGLIHINSTIASRGGRELLIVELADTGTGMPKDVQERVFEPFFTTKPDGTGLGMCVAASIMARHDGALLLESSDSGGTRWTVQIPVSVEQ